MEKSAEAASGIKVMSTAVAVKREFTNDEMRLFLVITPSPPLLGFIGNKCLLFHDNHRYRSQNRIHLAENARKTLSQTLEDKNRYDRILVERRRDNINPFAAAILDMFRDFSVPLEAGTVNPYYTSIG